MTSVASAGNSWGKLRVRERVWLVSRSKRAETDLMAEVRILSLVRSVRLRRDFRVARVVSIEIFDFRFAILDFCCRVNAAFRGVEWEGGIWDLRFEKEPGRDAPATAGGTPAATMGR